jgi:hypothetical protein
MLKLVRFESERDLETELVYLREKRSEWQSEREGNERINREDKEERGSCVLNRRKKWLRF